MSSIWTAVKYRGGPNVKLHDTHRVTQIKFKGWDQWRVQGAARRAKMSLDILGVKSAGPVSMPRRRSLWHFLKNPFKWKKHQELWEFRIYSRVITIEADVHTTKKVLNYIARTKYEGVGMRLRRLTFEPLDKYWKNPYLHTAEVNRGDRVQAINESKENHINWAGKKPLPKETPPVHLRVHHIKATGEHVDASRWAYRPKEGINVEEPKVLDEDIVYDDNDHRFLTTAFKKYDEQIDHNIKLLFELCKAKVAGELPEGENDWPTILKKVRVRQTREDDLVYKE